MKTKKTYSFKGDIDLGEAVKQAAFHAIPRKTPSLFISDILEESPQIKKELEKIKKKNKN